MKIRLGANETTIKEFNHERNYFFFELEHTFITVKNRLKKENRIIDPVGFECWINGENQFVFYVDFKSKLDVENQVLQHINILDDLEKQRRLNLIERIKTSVKEEKEVFANKEFLAFAVRFDQVMGSKSYKPIPFLLDMNRMESIFAEIHSEISSGFYSVLENIILSIANSHKVMVAKIKEELVLASQKSEKLKEEGIENNEEIIRAKDLESKSFLQVRVNTWFGTESNFDGFKKYVVSSYRSIDKVRINSLLSRFPPYQVLQDKLFQEHVELLGFVRCWEINQSLKVSFLETFDDLLFQGIIISSDEMVQSDILSPVIQQVEQDVLKECLVVEAKKESVEKQTVEETKKDNESNNPFQGVSQGNDNLSEDEKVIADEETGE